MKRLTRLGELKQALFGDAAYKALALLFALVAWVWVQNEQVVEERARARVVWSFPDGLVPVEPPLESATVTVEGIQAFVRAARQQDLAIAVDLSRAREGEVNVDLSERPIQNLPGQVRVAAVAPSTLKITLDRVLRRRIPVAVSTRGQVADGYRLAGVRIEPDRIAVSGPSSTLRALDEVPADTVDLSDLSEDATFEVGLALRPGQVVADGPAVFTVTVDVEPVIGERRIEGAPVEVSDARYAAAVATAAVVLAGPASALNAIDAANVRVRIVMPDGFDGAGAIAAVLGADDGPRVIVDHGGGEQIRAARLEPETLTLERK
jgi:YbbR domain-containing protein